MAVPFVKNFDDFAENMAVPNPNRPIQEAAARFGRSLCDSISNSPTFEGLGAQGFMGAVCTPYWDSQGYSPPEVDVPFTGGQCAGSRYVLTGTYVVACGFETGQTRNWQSTGLAIGPITGISFTGNSWQVNHAGQNVVSLNDTVFNQGILRAPTPQLACSQIGNQTLTAIQTPSISAVTPFGGDANNCGDPTGTLVPGPSPAPDPGPLPPDTGPSIDIRGNPVIILPPTVEISPGISFDFPIGEINLGGGGGTSAAEPPLPGSEMEGEGSAVGGGDNDFDDPPEGERWVGCCVRITARPVGHGSIPQSEPETIFPDIIGNVRLKFSSASQLPAYDTPLINKSKTLCVWEPVRGMQPIGVRVNLRPGFAYSYTPYSVPLEN